MIGARILQARKARGWSLAMLAEQIGGVVTRQALHKYEQGRNLPGSEVLLALAKALGVPLDFFFRPSRFQVALGRMACRKRARMGKKALAAVCAEASEQIERRLELESYFPAERFAEFRPLAAARVTSLEDVENVARAARTALKIGLDAIENLTEALEDAGVKVFTWFGADERFDGFACWANERIPVVVVRGGLPGDRQRSNLAHEFGHLVMDVAPDVDPEKAARRFSGAFLVPVETVRRELSSHRSHLTFDELRLLKKKYGMSMQQWVYRAKDLGIITEAHARGWFQWFRQQPDYPREPGDPIPAETSDRMERLGMQAVAEGLVSPARAAELAGMDLAQFRENAG